MKKYILVFCYFLVVRVLFIVVSRFDSCELCPDCSWINELSEKVIAGNYDFDIGRFIAAPFYNVFIAYHKLLFGSNWQIELVISQVLLACLSGVYFYKLAKLLFAEKIALISTLLFGIFPMTLWWVHTFCAESIFQSLLIISIYFLVKSIKTKAYSDVIISATIFSIIYLTKSHILLFTPFLFLYYLINIKGLKRFSLPILYTLICLLFSLPFGLYNLKIHNTYVVSSNGSKFHFYTGNSESGYISTVQVPKQGSKEFEEMTKMNMAYFNGDIHNQIMALPQPQKQDAFFQLSLAWIQANPIKFLKAKVYSFFLYVVPGVSFRHYPFKSWLFSFLISLPVYLLAYIGIYKSLKKNFTLHFFVLGLFFSMLLFSVIFYAQNRFRTITLEPFYLMYCTYGFYLLFENNAFLKKYLPFPSYLQSALQL